MSLLVIGSSHVGAVKLGLDAIRANGRSDLDVRFFAAPNKLFGRFRLAPDGRFGALDGAVNGKKLERLTEFNGTAVVDLGAFEQILWVGPYFNAHEIIPTLASFAIDEAHEVDHAFRLSEAAFREICRSIIGTAFAAMPAIADGRSTVTILQRPRVVTAGPAQATARTDQWFSKGIARKTLKSSLSIFDGEVETFLKARKVGLLRQPAATIAADGLTETRFIQNSKMLMSGADQNEQNLNHMNAEFGASCLADYGRSAGLSF